MENAKNMFSNFPWSLEHVFLTVGQNNFGNKILNPKQCRLFDYVTLGHVIKVFLSEGNKVKLVDSAIRGCQVQLWLR